MLTSHDPIPVKKADGMMLVAASTLVGIIVVAKRQGLNADDYISRISGAYFVFERLLGVLAEASAD